jgi:hypothetical protein
VRSVRDSYLNSEHAQQTIDVVLVAQSAIGLTLLTPCFTINLTQPFHRRGCG